MTLKKKINSENVPFQVQDLISKLIASKDNEFIKENYKIRLIDTKDCIEAALQKYDEMLRNREIGRIKK